MLAYIYGSLSLGKHLKVHKHFHKYLTTAWTLINSGKHHTKLQENIYSDSVFVSLTWFFMCLSILYYINLRICEHRSCSASLLFLWKSGADEWLLKLILQVTYLLWSLGNANKPTSSRDDCIINKRFAKCYIMFLIEI